MPFYVQLPQLLEYVLERPEKFPGIHNIPQERTSKTLPLMDTNRQMRVVWESTCSYIKSVLLSGKSLYVDGLGSFTFSADWSGQQKTHALKSTSPSPAHSPTLSPVFLPCRSLLAALPQPPQDKPAIPPKPGSSFQQGIRMSYLNRAPIARSCHYSEKLVGDVLKTIFQAAAEIAGAESKVELDLRFGVLLIDRSAKMKFDPLFVRAIKGGAHGVVSNAPVVSMSPPVRPIPLSPCWRSNTAALAQVSRDLNSVKKY